MSSVYLLFLLLYLDAITNDHRSFFLKKVNRIIKTEIRCKQNNCEANKTFRYACNELIKNQQYSRIALHWKIVGSAIFRAALISGKMKISLTWLFAHLRFQLCFLFLFRYQLCLTNLHCMTVSFCIQQLVQQFNSTFINLCLYSCYFNHASALNLRVA